MAGHSDNKRMSLELSKGLATHCCKTMATVTAGGRVGKELGMETLALSKVNRGNKGDWSLIWSCKWSSLQC
jgi:hypothetical protein